MKLIIPKHKKTSHKGQNGEVLIIGGSEDYIGCLALAGLAALRTGIDWITIAAPEKVAWAVSCLSPDLITKKYKGTILTLNNYNQLSSLADLHDTVLIGNGIGRDTKTRLLVKKLVKNIKKPKIIDADGIKAIGIDDVDNAIITPHKMELKLFLENSRVKDNILQKITNENNIIKKSKLIQKTINLKNNIILLKGAIDSIISKDRIIYVKGGNERMAVAGTGDVLAGLAAGFLAQKLSLIQAAYNASYINKKIGDYLKKKKGYSYIASDLINDYKKVI